MPVLFVTSFTRAMFDVTGERLVRTFLQSHTEGTLLVCHEGFDDGSYPRRAGVRSFKLDRSELLNGWLVDNRDIIPKCFGGLAGLCNCPEPRQVFGAHQPRCHGYWFNRNAARYFRKVVSLNYAMTLRGFDYVIWLDSDCVIKAGMPAKSVRQWFGGSDVFYHKSAERKVMESGVLGVRNSAGGNLFVSTTLARYGSGAFRRNLRWDDGYQFQLALKSLSGKIESVDLAGCSTGGRFGHVLPHSPAGRFIAHHKGIHARVLDLFP
jgi:hypothetical protein